MYAQYIYSTSLQPTDATSQNTDKLAKSARENKSGVKFQQATKKKTVKRNQTKPLLRIVC